MRDVTVLYDADCGFCTSVARRLGTREGVSLAPIRSARGSALLHDLPLRERDASLHVVDAAGVRRSGADALPGLLRRFRAGRPPAWLLERFPRAARLGYGLVARHRRALSRLLAVSQTRSVSRR
ncbi:MAG TPA: DCC1-like thiol-disulfide oxidoreductase family protein [Gaiella sp.]|jgi:predicted DCC family thiol-disulfide oxidoreductase YuxK